ncbi:DUF2169 domain-containing protein [Xanthomonas sp. AmX2]|uniref:DUF2169 family type VI secretion system accessory protein n=1 Tax=Xanthomonas sp. TaxID=29446 RepID=UPI0019818158|nr:DUF2169 domain-containing protein [Xanthomonas sp.]MBN6149741.1 DUF2169 domain-containing protein [Xanthomonas sp.]
MEFRNLTPFDALCYAALAPDDQEHTVVAMKVGYRLAPDPDAPGRLLPCVLDEAPIPLCTADEFYGEPGESSVREESDLAPYKPRCDVLLRGHAYAPQSRPQAQWDSRLRVSRRLPPVPPPQIEPPQGLAPNMPPSLEQLQRWKSRLDEARRAHAALPTHEVWLDKTLRVSGPRRFRRNRLRRGWHTGEADPVAGVPLRWENAWGGRSRVFNPQHVANAQAPAWLLDEVCFSNPLGRGWFDERQFEQAGAGEPDSPDGQWAPQFEAVDAPIVGPVVVRHPEPPLDAWQMAAEAARYGMAPAGFGALGRAWAPRLALAGSYDADWLQRRWPGLPQDFDFGYWNAAPRDQQTPHLPPQARIELWNLFDPAASGDDGRAWFDLPGHRPFVLLRLHDGALLPLPLLTDTVLIDTDAQLMTLTHRVSLPAGLALRALEARFESDPAAPLLRWPKATAGVFDGR